MQVVLQTNQDPYNVFTTHTFAGQAATLSFGTRTQGRPLRRRRRAEVEAIGKSILDYVLADLNRFSNIVGSADKISIQNHMQSVRDMEQTLAGIGTVGVTADGGAGTTASGGCGTAAVAATTAAKGTLDISNTSNIPTLLKLQFDMSAAALFASDMTRSHRLPMRRPGRRESHLSDMARVPVGRSEPSRPEYRRPKRISLDCPPQRRRQDDVRHIVPAAARVHDQET